MISKLKKLKGRSLAELADRARQKALVVAERSGVSRETRLLSDKDLLRSFGPDVSTANELLQHLRGRTSGTFYPVFSDRDSTIKNLRERFPNEASRLTAKADKICSGRFDLLGYQDLDFGLPVPDWHCEPVSGKKSPLIHWSKIDEIDASATGDKKIVWELNRHQYFTVLGSAYWLTENEAYAETAIAHIENWIEKNPPKIGLNWISSLEIAYRSISWIWAINYFINSRSLEPETLLRTLKCLDRNARHIEKHLSTYSSPNTHLTGEALGLYIIGAFFPELEGADRWKSLGYSILLGELKKQIREDGGYVEQSTHYQRYTTDLYLTLLILRRAEGVLVEKSHIEGLRRSLYFLMFAMQPNGKTPLIGDDDGGRLHFFDDRPIDDIRSTLALGASLLSDPVLKFAAGKATPELLWLAGPQALKDFDNVDSVSPDEKACEFQESGLYSMRDGWETDASFLLVDCGPHGFLNGGHAHADSLSFVFSSKGTPVFVDSGTYNYTNDSETRDHVRSTAAHNCLTVNGESSSVPTGPFSWKSMARSKLLEWNTNADGVLFRGTHDGFEKLGVRYEREIHFQYKGETRITDKIETKIRNSFEWHLILDPAIAAEIVGDMKVFLRTNEGNIEVLTIDTILAKDFECSGWKVEPAMTSLRYGSLVATTKLMLTIVADHDFDIVTRFIPAGM